MNYYHQYAVCLSTGKHKFALQYGETTGGSLEKGADAELTCCGAWQNLLPQVSSPANRGRKASVISEHNEPAGLPVQKTMKSHSIVIRPCSQW